MCGRYVTRTDVDGLTRLFVVDERHVDELAPSYNVAPTDAVPAVVEHADRRHLVALHWGLVPAWSRDRRSAARMINARSETAAEKPAFREALARRRCLLPADGFYEWERRDGAKLPWFVHRADQQPMALAGLWSVWRDPTDPGAEPVRTCAVLTTAATEPLAWLHDRMPVAIEPADWDRWLDRSVTDVPAVTDLLRPDGKGLRAYRVSTRVNSVANNDVDLLAPAAA